MGGGVSLPMPVSEVQKDILTQKYNLYSKERGCDDAELESMLGKKLHGIVVFDQIDADHSGSVSRAELKRLLHSLPRKKPVPPPGGWPDGVAPEFVPFEKMLSILDSDGDGVISMDEWLDNLEKLPGLKAAIEGAVDPATGRIAGYVSLERQLELLLAEAEERRAAGAPDDDARLVAIAAEAAGLQSAVGTVGLSVFRQLDQDGSGKIDRDELLRLLKQLPREDAAAEAALDVDEVMQALDYDGDGVIDEIEWVTQLGRLPALKAAIERSVDASTGKIKNFKSLMGELKAVRSQIAAGGTEAELADLRAREAALAAEPIIVRREKLRGEWAQSAQALLSNLPPAAPATADAEAPAPAPQ